MPLLTLALALVACETATDGTGTLDARVDHNGEDDTVESVQPRACLSVDGKLYSVWQDARTGVDAVWFNMTGNGKDFMPSDVPVSHGAAAAVNPAIACVGDRVYVAWEDERDGDYQYKNIYLNYSEDGGSTWQPDDVLLDGDVDGEHISLGPTIAAVGSAVYVAWYDNTDGAYDIYVQASTNAGHDWNPSPARADADAAGSAYSANPRVVADDTGHVVVAWEDRRGGGNDIYANASDDFGASFHGDDVRLDEGDESGASDSFSPSVTMSGDYVYAAWHDERFGAGRDILLSTSGDRGASWSAAPARVESDAEGIADSLNPQLAADGATLHVVWQDDRSGGYDIFYRRSDDAGASWTADETRCDTDEPGYSQSSDPVLVLAGDTVAVGWEDFRNDVEAVGFDDLFYNYSGDGGKSWQDADLRINSNAPGTSYAIDLTLYVFEKQVYSLWADGRYGTSDIFYTNRALGEGSVYVPPEEDAK